MTIKAHFDGKVFVPDEPVELPIGQQVTVQSEAVPERHYMTAGEFADSEAVGIWADRTDITDSTEFSQEQRRKIERREL